MNHVATILIPEFPGGTALWYARAYLEEAGRGGSDSETPEQSLANTLSKQVKTGREKRIRRERVKGVYCYFPVPMASTPDSREVIVQLSLSVQELKDIDNLVAVDKFKNRSDAIKWLVMEGIKANRTYLDKVADRISQIEQLKKEAVA
jgi:Arc/MetJ-type ribon-helix-helix transcriptional regulator